MRNRYSFNDMVGVIVDCGYSVMDAGKIAHDIIKDHQTRKPGKYKVWLKSGWELTLEVIENKGITS